MNIIKGILIVVGMIATGILVGIAWSAADAREAAYWTKLNLHVIQHGDEEGHDCPYSPEWCNPHYRKVLLERRGLSNKAK